jgi:hypothetical protein
MYKDKMMEKSVILLTYYYRQEDSKDEILGSIINNFCPCFLTVEFISI